MNEIKKSLIRAGSYGEIKINLDGYKETFKFHSVNKLEPDNHTSNICVDAPNNYSPHYAHLSVNDTKLKMWVSFGYHGAFLSKLLRWDDIEILWIVSPGLPSLQ